MDVVYIDGQIIDIDPKTSIAWTIQRIDIGDLSKNYSSFSNTIKALDTESNNRKFQHAKLDKGDGTFQYALQDCRLVQKGIETISQGKAQVIGFDGKFYNIVLYDPFVSLLSFIDGKTVADIDFGISAWNAADIDAARLSTSGFISACVNWGRALIYEANYFLPCYFYKTLIEKIFTSSGLTLSGDILSSTDFTDLVCTPVNKFLYPESASGNNTRISSVSQDVGFTVGDDEFLDSCIPFNIVSYGLSTVENDILLNPFKDIVVDSTSNVTIVLEVDVTALAGSAPLPQIQTRIVKNTSTILQTSTSILANGVVSITATVDVAKGDVIRGLIFASGVAGRFFTATLATASLTLTVNRTVVRTNVIWNLLTNKTPLKDVVKDFFVRFGIIYKFENNTLILKTLQDICNDTSSAVDWSNKRVNPKNSPIEFKTNYAQSNYFLHKDGAKDKFLGSGILSILNTALKDGKDFFTSAFSNARIWTGNQKVITTPAYDSTSTGIADIKTEPEFIIGTLKARTSEDAISFNGTPRTDYRLAYHADSTQVKDSSFAYFLSKYYPSLTFALQKNKICKYEYNLTETDIANYDPHKMIFDNGSYYLINKIKNFRSGKITEVELFKIQ